jgi:hypothetical protein
MISSPYNTNVLYLFDYCMNESFYFWLVVCNYNRMDLSRSVLDNLMGRDRNLPKNSTSNRDHYSNSDVNINRNRSANHS